MESAPKQGGKGQVLVIGGGRFGQLALERLGAKVGRVVEPEPTKRLTALASQMGIELRKGQGAQALEDALAGPDPFKWVVPALPCHLLMDWLLLTLPGAERLDVPEQALPELPSVIKGPDEQFFLSRADFLCPDDCPEPAEYCSVTKEPRGEALFDALSNVRASGTQTAVVRSHQMAPGVGGYKSSDLLQLRQRLTREGGDWLLATACRCHGVMGGIRLNQASGNNNE